MKRLFIASNLCWLAYMIVLFITLSKIKDDNTKARLWWTIVLCVTSMVLFYRYSLETGELCNFCN